MNAKGRTRAAVLLALTEQGPLTASELAESLGFTRSSVNGSLHYIRRTPGVVRIVAWQRRERSRGRMAPVYAVGAGADKPPPEPFTRKEIQERFRKAHRALLREKSRRRRGHALNPYLQLM